MIGTLHPYTHIYGDKNERYERLLMMIIYNGDTFEKWIINIPLQSDEFSLDGGRFVNFKKYKFQHVFAYTDKLTFLQNIINPPKKSKFECHLDWIAMNVNSEWNVEVDINNDDVTLIFRFEDEKIPALMKLLI